MKKILFAAFVLLVFAAPRAEAQKSEKKLKTEHLSRGAIALPDSVTQPRIVPLAEIESKDLLTVLEAMNVYFAKFDLGQFTDKTYDFTLYIEEFVANQSVDITKTRFGPNKLDINSYPGVTEEEKVCIRKEAGMAEGEDILIKGREMRLFIVPVSGNDSLSVACMGVDGIGQFGHPMNLKKIAGQEKPAYTVKPFAHNSAPVLGEKIPLLMYCSFWKDENGIVRCCMERVVNPDMKSESLKLIPHYFVLGVIVTESETQL